MLVGVSEATICEGSCLSGSGGEQGPADTYSSTREGARERERAVRLVQHYNNDAPSLGM